MTDLMTMLNDYLAKDPDLKQVLLIGMSPLFLLAFAIEYVVMRRRDRTEGFAARDILTNLSLGGSYQVAEVIYYTLFISAVFAFVHQFRLFEIQMTLWTWPLLMLGMEFSYYWFHRASHRVRWFWCAHVVHHSGEHMNMTTAMRQSLTYTLNLSHLFWVPLMLIGFPPAAVMLALAINLAYQYFIHTESMRRWPAALEFLLNTPSHHRVHHGRNAQYIDRNYGGIVIIWDRLFGTFEPEVEKVDYGIPNQINSHNLIKLNFHEWTAMFRDAASPGPLALRLKHFWAPPEWQRPTAPHLAALESQPRTAKPAQAA